MIKAFKIINFLLGGALLLVTYYTMSLFSSETKNIVISPTPPAKTIDVSPLERMKLSVPPATEQIKAENTTKIKSELIVTGLIVDTVFPHRSLVVIRPKSGVAQLLAPGGAIGNGAAVKAITIEGVTVSTSEGEQLHSLTMWDQGASNSNTRVNYQEKYSAPLARTPAGVAIIRGR